MTQIKYRLRREDYDLKIRVIVSKSVSSERRNDFFGALKKKTKKDLTFKKEIIILQSV